MRRPSIHLKNQSPSHSNLHSTLRRGLSFLEFVSFLVALAGGVVLGTMYLGVDLRTMAIGVLEKSQLIESGSLEDYAAEEEAEKEPAETVDSLAEQSAHNDNASLDQPATSEASTSASEAATSTDSEAVSPPPLTDEQRQFRTREYWLALTACMTKESDERVSGLLELGDWQLHDFLTVRYEGHSEAVEAIQLLDEQGVDPRLMAHGKAVLTWHRAGKKLYGRAVDLLTDAPSAGLAGPSAQSWQSSATQHRMEEKLLRSKHRAITGYLNHAFKSAGKFVPAFAK